MRQLIRLYILLIISLFLHSVYAFANMSAKDSKNNAISPTQKSSLVRGLQDFRYLTVNDGFTRNSIFKILQDKEGFVWFGSWDGVYRYDGTQLSMIYCTHNGGRSKKRQVINDLLEDDKQRIWIATSRGIAIWDAVYESLVPFSDIVLTGQKMNASVKSFCKDKKGNIWIVTAQDLYYFDIHNGNLSNMSKLCDGKIKVNAINRIYLDKKQQLWMGTNVHGVYRMDTVVVKPGENDEYKKWSLVEDARFKSFRHMSVNAIHQDINHDYWIGTNRKVFRVPSTLNDTVTGNVEKIGTFTFNTSVAIRVADFDETDDNIFAATNQGLFVYSLSTQKHVWVHPNYSVEGYLNDKNLRDLAVDHEGGLWIGTYYGGVNYLPPTTGNFSSFLDVNNHLGGHVVSGVAEDKNGNIWLGIEDGGVAFWDRKHNNIHKFNGSGEKKTYSPSRINVQTIYSDGPYVYVGTYGGGLDIIDVDNNTSRNINSVNTYPDKLSVAVYAILKTENKVLLLGGIDGLFTYNLNTNKLYKIPEVVGKVNNIIKDENGDYWVSTLFNGIYCYSKRTNKWTNYVYEENDTTSVACTDINTILALNSSIYIGTQANGLWEFRTKENKFYSLLPDSFGNTLIFKIFTYGDCFWLTTNKGLISYNRVTKQAQRYTVEDGLRSNLYKENSGIITSDGWFIVGGVNGINCFKPSELKSSLVKPNVLLTELRLFNQPVNLHTKDSPLQKSFPYTDFLEINQRHNNVVFKFSSSSYNDANKNKFQYKLEPFERDWQTTTQLNNSATYTNLPSGNYVFRVRTSNGEGVWSDEKCLNLKVQPYWWRSIPMKVVYAIVLFVMVFLLLRRNQQKKREEMRLFRFEKEQEVYHSKMEFFTFMVHEIRTPLTLILGPLSAIMKKTGRIEDVVGDLRIIERNGQRLLSLVNQLMDFRKVEERSYTVKMGTVDLKELVSQITSDFKIYKMQKPIHFEILLPEEECWANIDREAFTKVLANLLSNATKFTKDRIEVGLVSDDDKTVWKVYVRDNGRGVPKEEQSSIFESFYQVHQDLPGDYIGTGIGLFVVRRLLELQGGHIRLESKLGEGACFIATVKKMEAPVQVEEQREKVTHDVKFEEPPHEGSQEVRKRLLVVDDNDEMRAYIASLLEGKFDIDTCENGKVALSLAAKNEYDLVITDLMMPVMDGMTLCKMLKDQQATSHIPVIILTAKDDESSQKEGFESEADLYVIKPFSAEVFVSQVKAVIHNRERMHKQFYAEPETTAEVLCTNDSDKEFLEKFDVLINQNLENCNLSVDELAAEMALGRSVFYQKVKGVTGLTPNEYVRTFRLKKAVTLFQNGENRINEVCYRVGFSSPSYFTKRFTLQFGISPSDYLKKNGLA